MRLRRELSRTLSSSTSSLTRTLGRTLSSRGSTELAERPKPSKRGPKPKLSIEEQVLVTLEYWREYRTYFHIGTSWELSESTICRIVNKTEKMLLQSGNFRLKGKKALLNQAEIPVVTVMDVTETPIERPQKKQKDFFSGKRGYHTLKSQLVADQNTEEIICVFCGKGRGHDFSLFKKSRVRFHPLTTSIEDSGYQGIAAYHSNSYTPKKKSKNRKLRFFRTYTVENSSSSLSAQQCSKVDKYQSNKNSKL